jgi:hypothetical protein
MAKKTEKAGAKTSERDEGETGRKIWLAGIGAYGRAFSEAQGSLNRIGAETSKLFDDLVRRGEEIESHFESRRQDLADRVGDRSGISLQDRVKDMREKLKLRTPWAEDERLSAIEARLAKIESLLDVGADKPSPKKRKASGGSAGRGKRPDQ